MPVVQKGETVLVTGANGYIASHIIDQLLAKGYRVRGTVRSDAKGKWVHDFFGKKYDPGKIEVAVVPDMAAKGAFNDAVKGCTGVAHVASNLDFLDDPNAIIPSVISGINNVLDAASTEPKMARFVYTSSSTAATNPKPNKVFDIDENTWNTEAIEAAWAPPPYDGRRWDVYGASKTQAEQALWKYAEEKKPSFEVNAVLPNANFGTILNKGAECSTAEWVKKLYRDGTPGGLLQIPPQWFVDVADTARLHVSALTNPSVKNERVFAFAEPYNWNRIIRTINKIEPEKKIAEVEDNSEDKSNLVRKPRAEELLRIDFGKNGFTGLEESVRTLLESL